jgi:hypothetical protein
MTNRAYARRLMIVVGVALVADWATKAIARLAVRAGGRRQLLPGLQLVHLQRIGLPSSFTLAAAAAVLMVAGAAAMSGRPGNACRGHPPLLPGWRSALSPPDCETETRPLSARDAHQTRPISPRPASTSSALTKLSASGAATAANRPMLCAPDNEHATGRSKQECGRAPVCSRCIPAA